MVQIVRSRVELASSTTTAMVATLGKPRCRAARTRSQIWLANRYNYIHTHTNTQAYSCNDKSSSPEPNGTFKASRVDKLIGGVAAATTLEIAIEATRPLSLSLSLFLSHAALPRARNPIDGDVGFSLEGMWVFADFEEVKCNSRRRKIDIINGGRRGPTIAMQQQQQQQ